MMISSHFGSPYQCVVVRVDSAPNFEQQVVACPQNGSGIKAKTTDQAETWTDVGCEQ
jgi:hypothetical protein